MDYQFCRCAAWPGSRYDIRFRNAISGSPIADEIIELSWLGLAGFCRPQRKVPRIEDIHDRTFFCIYFIQRQSGIDMETKYRSRRGKQ